MGARVSTVSQRVASTLFVCSSIRGERISPETSRSERPDLPVGIPAASWLHADGRRAISLFLREILRDPT